MSTFELFTKELKFTITKILLDCKKVQGNIHSFICTKAEKKLMKISSKYERQIEIAGLLQIYFDNMM